MHNYSHEQEFFDFLEIPFCVVDNGKIEQYNNSSENIFSIFKASGISDIGSFLYQNILNQRKLITLNQEKYLLKFKAFGNKHYIVIINLTDIFSEYSSFIDIGLFLHEVKNPLTVIDGTVQVLKNKTDNDYTSKCSDIISNECKRLKDFIDDFGSILDIKLNREEFYILDFFKEMMDSLKILFNDVTFTCEIASDLKLITGDRGYLYKAFYNILKNACEANPAGEIKIIYTVDSTIKYKDSEKNRLSSMAKFIIIDQAGGIPREIQDKMFIPFFTTKSKGNGLGLVIAKEIIERHKGRLAFSTNNIGTVFTVFLPL